MVQGVDKEGEKIIARIYPDDGMRQMSLVLDIKNIASAVCPTDFANCVKEYSKEMYNLMKKKDTTTSGGDSSDFL